MAQGVLTFILLHQMLNLMLNIKVSSLIQITNKINVFGFELKVDLKIARNTIHAESNTQVKQTQTGGVHCILKSFFVSKKDMNN